ncbi:MAG TPA: ABC transporter permease, partial [Burkholderiales bacterium]|nr:ABC transporter permease [Burkholderiales bacterium]
MRRGGTGRYAFLALVVALYVFLVAPIVIVVIASLNSGRFLVFPPEGLSLQWYVKFLDSGPFVRSFVFSLRLAALVTVITTLVGTTAALFVVRHARESNLLRMLLVAPLQLPGIMTALALLIFYYGIGLGGTSYLGLLMGHVVVCTPYVFLTVSAVLYNFDRALEEAARSLGAGRLTTFRRITLPIIKGGVISGAVFAFITSFDQFPISLLLSGVGTTTLPIQVFDYLRFSFDPTAAAVGTVNILMTLGVVILTERLGGL